MMRCERLRKKSLEIASDSQMTGKGILTNSIPVS